MLYVIISMEIFIKGIPRMSGVGFKTALTLRCGSLAKLSLRGARKLIQDV